MKISPSITYKRTIKSPGGMGYVSQVMTKAIQLKKQGKTIINCGLGEPSHGLKPEAIKMGIWAIKKDEYDYVKPIFGLNDLRNKISSKLSLELKTKISPEQIIVTPGSEVGLDLIFKTLLNPKDEIIVFDPFFISFAFLPPTYGAKVVLVETYSSSFLPNMDKLKKAINKKTKMIILNSPHNPSGRIIPKKIVEQINSLAKSKGILVLSDEAYKDFDYTKTFYSPFIGNKSGTIILRTFSKGDCMMGYKVGYIIAPKKVAKLIRSIMQPGWSAPRISSHMGIEALKKPFSEADRKRYQKLRDTLYDGLSKVGIVDYCPEGAFYFYLETPNKNGLNFAMDLLDDGILMLPGFSSKNTRVRLSYGKLKINQVETLLKKIGKYY